MRPGAIHISAQRDEVPYEIWYHVLQTHVIDESASSDHPESEHAWAKIFDRTSQGKSDNIITIERIDNRGAQKGLHCN